jgi:hypothetical protein
MSFDPATLTRASVIAAALADPIFVAGLKQLQAAEGFGPESISGIDDHNSGTSTFKIDNVVVVVRFDADGSPSKPRRTAKAQDGNTHLPAWIMPGCYRTRGEDFDWGRGRCKNPLFVESDGKVHLTTMATGSNLRFWDEEKDFDTMVRKNRGVYTQSCGWGNNIAEEMHEAHVWMTVAELAALT